MQSREPRRTICPLKRLMKDELRTRGMEVEPNSWIYVNPDTSGLE